jgi:transcriptional regulator with XRE-family HTH domain
MLSAYETGKQKPSLDTLEKILEALGCDLNDLHNSLQIVNERPEAIRKPGDQRAGTWDPYRRDRLHDGSGEEAAVLNIYRVLGINKPLSSEEEQAFGEMLQGFHRLLRYLHATVSQAVTERDAEGEEPA